MNILYSLINLSLHMVYICLAFHLELSHHIKNFLGILYARKILYEALGGGGKIRFLGHLSMFSYVERQKGGTQRR